MNNIKIFNNKRKESQNFYTTLVFCLNEQSANLVRNENKYDLETLPCGVMCDDATFEFLQMHPKQTHDYVVFHKKDFDQIKHLHFYKEICYFSD